MISADRDAMRELLELAAVPAQKTLNSLMGRRGRYIEGNKGSVFGSFWREASTFFHGGGRDVDFLEKEEVRMLYFMDREQAQHLISADLRPAAGRFRRYG